MVDVSGSGRWRRSTRCADAACVEVDSNGSDDDVVLVRNAAEQDVELPLTTGQWRSFVDAVKSGTFEPAAPLAHPDASG